MNSNRLWPALAALLFSASPVVAQTTLAKWTFETTQPGVVDGPAVPGAGIWLTNIAAETGSGIASGLHAGSTTYSSPAGNGSPHSFSCNTWAVGDCFQFALSTVGYTNLIVTYDQIGSATGPGRFYLAYSTDGVNFTQVGAVYNVITNTGTTTWASATPITGSSYSNDLSSVTALADAPVVYIRLVDASTTSVNGGTVASGGTDRIDNFGVLGTSLPTPPHVTGITPANLTANAGTTASFTVTATGTSPSYSWFKTIGGTTNSIPGATTATLTLPNLTGADEAYYYAVLTNSLGADTSSQALLIVNDPAIAAQPANVQGLLDGTVHFAVSAAGTGLSYRWYFADANGTPLAQVPNGPQASGSLVSGAGTSTLQISNLQPADPTNFVVVVTGTYGQVTSTAASLLSVDTTATLAYWDFNGPEFTNLLVNPNSIRYPVPYLGVGTAQAVGSCDTPGTSPFSGSVDPENGTGLTTHLPNFSWGTDAYPLTGGNKQNGVQFNVSTMGAKDITVSYDSRVTSTASAYERLQYTTNGTDWVDYPASSSFLGLAVSTYYPFTYSLAGFPGVDNNPNFGIRVVTEFQNTATYGIGTTSDYVGEANTYGTAGTVTYDIVNISGVAITNNNLPPTLSAFTDTNTPDYIPLTLGFTVSDDTTAPDQLTYSAVSLNPSTVNPAFTFGGSGPNRTLTITPNTIPDAIDAAPILVTVTDANGDSTAGWFLLTLTSVNLPPTNSLVGLRETNLLANSSLTIPFSVGDDRTAVSGLSYSVDSANSTLIPSANIVVGNQGTANPTLTITPAHNQVGVARLDVSVNDNDSQEPRSTTATLSVMVRPNTNVVAIDYFNYDASGALDSVSGGYWQHLTGILGQMQVGSGVVTIDTLDNTENLQTTLLGAPYRTNSGRVLYASFIVNLADLTRQPRNNGTYFALFNDGSGVTGPYECRVLAATNGAAPGYYRLGINNFGADATTGQMFPEDLVPDSNYVVVTSLVLSNGMSTLWVNPLDSSSLSVTDPTPSNGTNLYNISAFELRESGANAGAVSLSKFKAGTTFDSVFPGLQVRQAGADAVVSWSDPTLSIQSSTNVTGPYLDDPGAVSPYTNHLSTSPSQFFRFKRTD